ncbi:MAG TPA: DUF3618 domain-containing protein [Jiangellaceae bacterium]
MSVTDPALPSSRQPVPIADEVQAELDRRPRTTAEIERELDERTQRLVGNIDALNAKLNPSRIARDSVARVKSRFTTPSGGLRPEVVGAVAGALIGVGVLIWRARRR